MDEIPDDNLDIILYSDLELDNVNNPFFNTANKKWNFDINLMNYYYFQEDSKIIIDIIHSGKKTTGTCRYNTNEGYKFKCISDYEYQYNSDIFEISSNIIYSTVTYKDITKLPILFNSKLKFEKAYNLSYNEYENCWIFNINVSESNLTNNRYTQVDLREGSTYRTATCGMKSNILSCKSNKGRPYYSVYLTKKNSKYIYWINLDKEEHIYLNLYLSYRTNYGTFFNGKWIFNIIYFYINNRYDSYNSYYYNYALLDIDVNKKSQTAICDFAYDNYKYYLRCECNYENQNAKDVVRISGNKNPSLGTIYFIDELSDKEKEFKNSKFNMNILNFICQNDYKEKLSLTIRGYLMRNYDLLSSETFTEIKMKKICGDKSEDRAACKVYYYNGNNSISLNCITDNAFDLNKEGAKISIDNGLNQYVEFNYLNESYITCNGTTKCNEGKNISIKISLLFLFSMLLL